MREPIADDRLVDQEDAPLVERVDDLVGGAHVLLALRLALGIGLIGLERAAPLGLGAVERVLRADQHLADVAGVARRGDAADRHGHGDRARPLVCTTSSRAPASRRSAATSMSSGVQLFRMTPNLLPEKRPR